MVEIVHSWFRDKHMEPRQTANKLSEVNIIWVFQSDKYVTLHAKLLKIETVTLAFSHNPLKQFFTCVRIFTLRKCSKVNFQKWKNMEGAFSI